jgi:hypothetical protein
MLCAFLVLLLCLFELFIRFDIGLFLFVLLLIGVGVDSIRDFFEFWPKRNV